MLYKGVRSIDRFTNGSWYTDFYLNDEVIKTVEWQNNPFNSDHVKDIIDKYIIPFI